MPRAQRCVMEFFLFYGEKGGRPVLGWIEQRYALPAPSPPRRPSKRPAPHDAAGSGLDVISNI